MKYLHVVSGILLVLIALSACGPGSRDGEPDTIAKLVVSKARANLTLPTETGAIYMVIANGTGEDETLLSASLPGCGSIEFHKSSMDGDVMVMRPVECGKLLIPAGESVELKRGGLHMMCLGKTGEFQVGDSVNVTLHFANAGSMEVVAEVVAPGEMENMP